MSKTEKSFTPAAGHDWLLPFYDFFTKLLGVESVHRLLIDQASVQPGNRLLEIGCGTGNLVILAKKLHPGASVSGIDPDPKALALARKKTRRAGLEIEFEEAFSDQLHYPDASIDYVFSAFMLHHVQSESKISSLQEVLRILSPGGYLLLADFEAEEHSRGHHLGRSSHSHPEAHDHPRITHMMQEAGFTAIKEFHQQSNFLGRVACFSAQRP